MKLTPGEIHTHDLGRRFRLAGRPGRTLKGIFTRHDACEAVDFWALRHITFDVRPGETFGIVGHNGSGKSTLLKMIARVFGPTEGYCEVGGRVSSLLELGAGFHPEFSAAENIFLAGAVYGIPRTEINQSLDAILNFAELDAFRNQPIKTFSSGMFMRLGFAVAMHVRPDILLLDEALAVGDARFVQKCFQRIEQFREGGGTLVLVTHDAAIVRRICDRAMHLERGRMMSIGDARDVVDEYIHSSRGGGAHPHGHLPSAAGAVATIQTSTLSADGVHCGTFYDGDAIDLRIEISVSADVSQGTIRVAVNDESGFELGVRFLREVDLDAGGTYVFDLHGMHGALRQGSFLVSAALLDKDSGDLLCGAPNTHEFVITSRDSDHFGPIKIDGAWSERKRVAP